jgi:hypothetical protein
MEKQKILYICGSLNQTTQMHQISKELPEYDAYFTPYYPDGYGYIKFVTNVGLLDFSILGGQAKQRTINYLKDNDLNLDLNGSKLGYYLVKYLNFPRWMASTSVTGISNYYDKFCVASEGYRKLFIQKGVNPEKIEVTGIPNFDNCIEFLNNDFPHHGYALVATSDVRETYKYENRKKFIQKAYRIANGKQLIFKLHPNENYQRASKEINKYASGSLVFHHEPIEPIIANCDILVTRFSTVAYIGLALGKEVYSEFEVEQLKELVPIQNGGTSAFHIAQVGRRLLAEHENSRIYTVRKSPVKHIPLKEKLRFRKKLAKIKH